MWFDSVVHSPDITRALIDLAGPGRLVVGSDYPFDRWTPYPGALVAAVPGLTEGE